MCMLPWLCGLILTTVSLLGWNLICLPLTRVDVGSRYYCFSWVSFNFMVAQYAYVFCWIGKYVLKWGGWGLVFCCIKYFLIALSEGLLMSAFKIWNRYMHRFDWQSLSCSLDCKGCICSIESNYMFESWRANLIYYGKKVGKFWPVKMPPEILWSTVSMNSLGFVLLVHTLICGCLFLSLICILIWQLDVVSWAGHSA